MSLVLGLEVVSWVAKRTNEYGSFGVAATGIGWQKNGQLVAGVVYCDWNGPNIVCHIASDGTRRWLTKEYLRVIFDYPFNQVKAQRITVTVGEGNKDSRRFVEHLGFVLEATLENAHPSGSLLIYKMTHSMCRWLKHENLHKARLAMAA